MRIKLLVPIMVIVVLAIVLALAKKQESTDAAQDATSIQLPTNSIHIQDSTGKPFELSIEDIPVYKAYLDAQEDIMTEIEQTRYEVINTSTEGQFILLKYSCGNKQCSTILIKVSDNKITSIALADGIFQDYKTSQQKDKLLVRYGYNEGGAVVRHILIGIDLLDMKVIPFESLHLAEEYMYTPTWPIIDYQLTNDEMLTIETADLSASDFNSVKKWYEGNELKTKKVEVLLSKTRRLDSYLER